MNQSKKTIDLSDIDDIAQLNTKKFLRTNLNDYLKHEPMQSISKQDDFKDKRKILQFRYNKGMVSNYNTNFN